MEPALISLKFNSEKTGNNKNQKVSEKTGEKWKEKV